MFMWIWILSSFVQDTWFSTPCGPNSYYQNVGFMSMNSHAMGNFNTQGLPKMFAVHQFGLSAVAC